MQKKTFKINFPTPQNSVTSALSIYFKRGISTNNTLEVSLTSFSNPRKYQK